MPLEVAECLRGREVWVEVILEHYQSIFQAPATKLQSVLFESCPSRLPQGCSINVRGQDW